MPRPLERTIKLDKPLPLEAALRDRYGTDIVSVRTAAFCSAIVVYRVGTSPAKYATVEVTGDASRGDAIEDDMYDQACAVIDKARARYLFEHGVEAAR